MTRRARFEVRERGHCVVLTQPNGRVRAFHIPFVTSGKGYVREGSNMGPQVCAGLIHRGSTLTASAETLLDVIRAEWRVYRNSEAYQYESAHEDEQDAD